MSAPDFGVPIFRHGFVIHNDWGVQSTELFKQGLANDRPLEELALELGRTFEDCEDKFMKLLDQGFLICLGDSGKVAIA